MSSFVPLLGETTLNQCSPAPRSPWRAAGTSKPGAGSRQRFHPGRAVAPLLLLVAAAPAVIGPPGRPGGPASSPCLGATGHGSGDTVASTGGPCRSGRGLSIRIASDWSLS